jgi:hypothetical protein
LYFRLHLPFLMFPLKITKLNLAEKGVLGPGNKGWILIFRFEYRRENRKKIKMKILLFIYFMSA